MSKLWFCDSIGECTMKAEDLPPVTEGVKQEPKIIQCHFPGCTAKNGAEQNFPVQLTDEDAAAELPFCMYHWYIACSGIFKCKMTKAENPNDDKFELVGPFEKIELIEVILASKELVEKSHKSEKIQGDGLNTELSEE